jgi:large subunit ribosomal protein L29
MKMADVRGLGPDELQEKVKQLKKELMQFRFQAKTGKLEQQSVISRTKKDIARLMTALNDKKEAKS